MREGDTKYLAVKNASPLCISEFDDSREDAPDCRRGETFQRHNCRIAFRSVIKLPTDYRTLSPCVLLPEQYRSVSRSKVVLGALLSEANQLRFT